MSDHPDCGGVGDLDPTGHLCVRCLCFDHDERACKALHVPMPFPPESCRSFAERKDARDQTVYFVFCRSGDRADTCWPTEPDGHAIYLGLDPQRETLEVWLWFTPLGVDVSGLKQMPFVTDIYPAAIRYARFIDPF